MGDERWQRKQISKKWRKEIWKTEIAMGNCIKNDLERVGGNREKEQQIKKIGDY